MLAELFGGGKVIKTHRISYRSCIPRPDHIYLFLFSNQLFKHGRYQESLCIYFTSLVCWW